MQVNLLKLLMSYGEKYGFELFKGKFRKSRMIREWLGGVAGQIDRGIIGLNKGKTCYLKVCLGEL